MAPATLSYAQSLRTIGQTLEAPRIQSFQLEKSGDEYIVRMVRSQSPGKVLREESFLKRIAERIWGGNPPKDMPDAVRIAGSDVDRLDTEGRSKRGKRNAGPDVNNLSVTLRVLGDYLDEKKATEFAISWFPHSVTVSYNHKRESFTVENLYDRGVRMYLRRSKPHGRELPLD